MNQPHLESGARACIVLTRQGLTVYGNPPALRTLAKWLEWIASAPPSEHYECHVGMDLEDEESKFHGGLPRNVWVLVEEALALHVEARQALVVDGEPALERGFDLKIMGATERDLDDLAETQAQGLLPETKG